MEFNDRPAGAADVGVGTGRITGCKTPNGERSTPSRVCRFAVVVLFALPCVPVENFDVWNVGWPLNGVSSGCNTASSHAMRPGFSSSSFLCYVLHPGHQIRATSLGFKAPTWYKARCFSPLAALPRPQTDLTAEGLVPRCWRSRSTSSATEAWLPPVAAGGLRTPESHSRPVEPEPLARTRESRNHGFRR